MQVPEVAHIRYLACHLLGGCRTKLQECVNVHACGVSGVSLERERENVMNPVPTPAASIEAPVMTLFLAPTFSLAPNRQTGTLEVVVRAAPKVSNQPAAV
jgi:hypothetical protein